MKKNVFLLLTKSFLRSGACIKSLFFISLAVVLIVSGLPLCFSIFGNVGKINADTDNGSYDVLIRGSELRSNEMFMKKLGENDCCFFDTEVITDDESGLKLELIYSDEKLLAMSTIRILSGSFPSSDTEVLCENSYFENSGRNPWSYIGRNITVCGKTYTVSGITGEINYDNHLWLDGHLIFFSDIASSSVYIDIPDCQSAEEANKFANSIIPINETWNYTINEWKFNSLESIEEDVAIIYLIVGIASVSAAFLLFEVSSYILNSNADVITVCFKNGVPEWKFWLASIFSMFEIVTGALLSALSLITAAFYVFFPLLGIKVYSFDFELVAPPCSEVLQWLLAETLLCFVCILIAVFRQYSFSTVKENKVYYKTDINKQKNVFVKMARVGLKSHKLLTCFSVITIALLMTLVCGISFYLDTMSSAVDDYGDFRYRFYFDTSYIDDSADMHSEYESVRDALENDQRVNIQISDILLTSFYMPKSDISKSFSSFCSFDSNFYAALSNPLIETVPVPVGIIPASVATEFGLPCPAEGEGLILDTAYKLNKKVFSTDKVDFSLEYGDSQSLQMRIVSGEIRSGLFTNSVFVVMVVNDTVYTQMTGVPLIPDIYISGDVSEKEILNYINSYNYLAIEKIGIFKDMNEDAAADLSGLAYALFAFCMVYGLASIAGIIVLGISSQKKEYSTLVSLGVPFSKLTSIFIIEFSYIILPVLSLCALGSYAMSKAIIALSDNNMATLIFPFPLRMYLISACGIVLVAGACLAVIISSMKRQTAIQLLQQR